VLVSSLHPKVNFRNIFKRDTVSGLWAVECAGDDIMEMKAGDGTS